MENNNKAERKLKRQQARELLDEYHKMVTEQALEPLFQSFLEWKQGTLPYHELTELIHLFHKKNQDIYKEFQYTARNELVLYAKFKLGRLSVNISMPESHYVNELEPPC